jgi:exosome complex protein LRP1
MQRCTDRFSQAGNDKYDLERAEQQAKERAKAHIKFQELSKKRKAPETEPTTDEEKFSLPSPEMVESVPQKLDDLSINEDTPDQIPKRRKRKDKAVQKQETVEDPSTEEAAAKTKRRELKRQRKEERREKRRQEDEAKGRHNVKACLTVSLTPSAEPELILASSKQPLSAAFQARFSKPP